MWNVIREFLRRAPLLALILLIWLILSIVSLAGRRGPYRNYSTKGGRLPGLSLVMQGIHDHVMPWSDVPEKAGGGHSDAGDGKTGQDTELADSTEGSADDSDAGDGASPDGAEDEASGGDEKTGSGGDEKEASGGDEKAASSKDEKTGASEGGAASEEGKESRDKAAEKKDSSAEAEKATDAGKSADAKKSADGGNTSESGKTGGSKTKEDGDTKAEGSRDSGSDKKKADSKTDDRGIPESSGSSVVTAKNYGVANKEYLSPEGTVFNTDQEGLFAPNGIFYPLQEVEDSYFSDALFVGDSRTVGLYEYGNMQSVTSFLARESTTVYDLFDDNAMMDYSPKGKSTIKQRTLKDLLSKAKFKKIYLSVGVNELGIPDTEDFYEEYRKVIKKINKLQPGAIIYIQGIMHVSKAMSSKDPVFNNTAIVQRNRAISTLANGRSIFYIDMNSELCDKDGNLLDELTGDGIHLKASSCEIWHSFLKKNAAAIPD